VFFIQVAYLVALGVFVVSYRVHWIDARSDFFGPIPFLVPWFGAVGAVVLSLKGVFDHRGRSWNGEYCFWHWSRPLVGGVVGTVSVLILQSGILAVGGTLPNEAQGPATTKNLLYYIVAFVVGYREDVFRELIARLADTLFSTSAEDAAMPVIESVEPETAPAGRETTVKLVGSGFSGANSVKLGGESVVFKGESDTLMEVVVPAEAPGGRMSLVVTTKHGTATTPFTVTPASG
jgi:IPT/TIG domain